MATQFLGALNDNLYKLIVSLIIIDTVLDQTGGGIYLSLAQALFVLPFIIFSPFSGYLADRYSKTKILRWAKVMEIVVMGFGLVFFTIGNVPALLTVLFFMGLHSTLFSPAKYGILPELLSPDHLSKGNGYLELWTFLAIILGTAVGGVIKSLSDSSHILPGLCVVAVAILGWLASLRIQVTPAGNPNAPKVDSYIRDLWETLKEIRCNKPLYLSLIANVFFWFVGSLFQLDILLYAKRLLGVGDLYTGLLMTALALGIGIGSVFAGKVSEGKVEMGLVPIGAMGMSLFGILLNFSGFSFALTLVFLFLLGVSCGYFVVPINAYFQLHSPVDRRGRYLAAMNFVVFSGMLLSSALFTFLTDVLELDPGQISLLIGLSTIGVAVYICTVLPEVLVRCVNWLLSHTLYKVHVVGSENVPKVGGALLVCNHVSYVDPSLLLASIERPIRFIMYRPIYEAKLINPIVRIVKAIPVSPEDHPKEQLKSLMEAGKAIKNGELVCIFAEGGITRTGQLMPFKRGLERVMKGIDAPIIPVYLDQVWGSIFSFSGGKFLWKRPKELPYPVTISFGKPLPGAATTHEIRLAVQELASETFRIRRREHQLLHFGFLRVAKRNFFRQAVCDTSGLTLRYGALLGLTLKLSQIFKRLHPGERFLGVLLPASVSGVLANLSLLMAGKVPVNLNFTAATESLKSAVKQCEIKTLITSRTFLEKLEFSEEFPSQFSKVYFVEELLPQLVKGKVVALLKTFVTPIWLIERLYFNREQTRDELATVIFSSGSTGEPKGVMLSHGNISSNLESLYRVFQLGPNDCVMGVLPFFHSFGFTGTLFLPLLGGIRAVYHPNPLECGVVGEKVAMHKATILMSTPTFLMMYARKCEPEQFKSLRLVIVGAEKLKSSIAETFKEKFGIYPLEGYGATELSPVATINLPDFESTDVKQIGTKAGTAGHPLPGIAARVVDSESLAPLETGREGLLLIRGPNVMKGYLGRPDLTAEVIRDGWYVTGDIAIIDEDGFVTITDRLSRFSKIGGEMVPHIKIEDEIHRILGEVEHRYFVTSVPDEKKGERLVVLSLIAVETTAVIQKLQEGGLPNLWIPKPECFLTIDKFPLLGSGKLDLKRLKEIAKESLI